MKVHIDIECTPEEARTFFGLPDVAPMHAAMMEEVHKRLSEALKASDPETLLRTWMPLAFEGGLKGWEQFQREFWSQMGAAGGAKGSSKD